MCLMEKKILICGHRSFVATGLINKFKTAGIDFDCFSRGKEERNGNVVTGDVFLMHQNSELLKITILLLIIYY